MHKLDTFYRLIFIGIQNDIGMISHCVCITSNDVMNAHLLVVGLNNVKY